MVFFSVDNLLDIYTQVNLQCRCYETNFCLPDMWTYVSIYTCLKTMKHGHKSVHSNAFRYRNQ